MSDAKTFIDDPACDCNRCRRIVNVQVTRAAIAPFPLPDAFAQNVRAPIRVSWSEPDDMGRPEV